MFVINKKNEKSTGGNFTRGPKAVTIDNRSGFKIPYVEAVFEPGTNFWVERTESDKDFSMVSHSQNYPPEKQIEHIGLKFPSSDVQLSVAAASIGALFPT